MIEEYVDLDPSKSLDICTAQYLTGRKRPGLIVKNLSAYPLTDEDLARLGAARFEEPTVEGYRRTGKAVLVGQAYTREYRDQTPAEVVQEADSDYRATDVDAPHILEMLIIGLIEQGVIAATIFPQDVRDMLADRKAKREAR